MRLTATRVLAGLFAFGWIVLPGFGAIDLTVTWSSEWPQVLEAGWGLFFTVLVGVPFVVAAVRPRASRAGIVQLAVATVALTVSVLVGEESPLVWVVVALVLQTAVVGALAAPTWRAAAPRAGVSVPLLVLALAGAGSWLAYATDMWDLNRQDLPDADITNGIDHYAVQGALGLALVLLPLLAAARASLRPLVSGCVGVVASYLGLVSLAWQDAAGGLSTEWSAAAIAWGLALLAVTLVELRRM
jgi:hypothetical protein